MTNPRASPSSNDADGAGETFQRIEVISGTGRRRKWSRRRKESIVLETLEEGASVSEVARRHGVDASQVFKWRRDAGLRSRPSASEPVMFAPLLIEQKDAPQPEQREAAPLPSGLIERLCGLQGPCKQPAAIGAPHPVLLLDPPEAAVLRDRRWR